MPRRRYVDGDRPRDIKKAHLNAFLDTTEMMENVRGGNGVHVTSSHSGLSIIGDKKTLKKQEPAFKVLVYNDSSDTTFNRYDAAVITDHFTQGFRAEVQRILNVDKPSKGFEGKFVICAETIHPGFCGQAWLMGMCMAHIKNDTGQDAVAADIQDGQVHLQANTDGSAQVFWEDDSVTASEEHLALIRFGPIGTPTVLRPDFAMTADDDVIDESVPPDPSKPDSPKGYFADAAESQRIEADGHEVVEGDVILTSNQPEVQQGVFIVKQNDFWTFLGRPTLAFVQHGDAYTLTLWGLFTPEPTIPVPEPEPFYRLTRAGWF